MSDPSSTHAPEGKDGEWISFFTQFGSPAARTTDSETSRLGDLLREQFPQPPSTEFRALWIYEIIQGDTPGSMRYCRDEPELGRFDRRDGGFTLSVFLPSSVWMGATPEAIRKAWAQEYRRAFTLIVERARKSKIALDGDRFLADLEDALARYLDGESAGEASGSGAGPARGAVRRETGGVREIPESQLPACDDAARASDVRRRRSRAKRATAPELITLAPDDSHLEHVGRLADGRGYFATTAWVDQQDIERTAEDAGVPGEYIAIYIFNRDGSLAEARIEAAGDLDADARDALWEKRLSELGRRRRARIKVAPFVAERSGVRFGLVATPPDGADDDGVQEDTDELGSEAEGSNWRVTLEPGATLVFFPPWDGTYDT